MSADLLRQAAALLRQRAERMAKECPGPWWLLDPSAPYQQVWYGDEAKVKAIDAGTVPEEEWEGIWAGSNSVHGGVDLDPPLAQWAALMQPSVGFALADWLEKFADLYDESRHRDRPVFGDYGQALAVARALAGADDA